MIEAVHVLEKLPGIIAMADPANSRIVVDYWIDEYMLSQIEFQLFSKGYPLQNDIRSRIQRAEIQRDEEAERDLIDLHLTVCYASGVFAKTYDRGQTQFQALPD